MKKNSFAFDKLELINRTNLLINERLSQVSAIDALTKRKVKAMADPRLKLVSTIKTSSDYNVINKVLDELEYDNLELSSKLDKNSVKAMAIYCLSLKDFEDSFEGSEASIQLLLDMYKNAYLEAALSSLKDGFHKMFNSNNFSPIFGPGYFGMDIKKAEVFSRLLDLEQIGVRVIDNSFSPEKTCVGMILILDDDYICSLEKEDACSYCGGNTDGCQFCSLR